MTELERVQDPRCVDALRHLAGKQLPDGGFPVEARTARTVDMLTSNCTFADWGPSGRSRANVYVTIDATRVLRAGRATPEASGPRRGRGRVHWVAQYG
jgi:hypothetical protein